MRTWELKGQDDDCILVRFWQNVLFQIQEITEGEIDGLLNVDNSAYVIPYIFR